MTDPKQSRGYRNRNPGNIDFNPANKWQGQAGLGDLWMPQPRRRFAAFESHEFGIRALAVLLTTYQDRHGLRTVAAIINRWAPPEENETSAYVAAVARAVGVGPQDQVDVHRYATMRPLVEAIIRHELGGNPYDAATIDEGLRRAGVVRPVATVREAAATGTGQGAITAASVTAAAGAAAPVLAALGGLPEWTGVALVLVAGLAVVAWILSRRRDSAA